METITIIVAIAEIACGVYAIARDARFGAGIGLIILGVWILLSVLL